MMRTEATRRVLVAVCLLSVVFLFTADVRAGEDRDGRPHDVERIIEGLEHGVEALQAMKGQEELAGRLQRLLGHLRERKAARDELNQELATARRWLELFHLAHDVLQGAERDDHADVAKRARESLQMMVRGRRDEEAKRVHERRPTSAQQGDALLLAAEILADQGKAKRARMLAELGRHFQGKRREGENAERRAYLEGLKRRVAAMRVAVKAFAEADRQDLVKQITRAIHTGELLLEGRDDEEAQQVYDRTPNLGQLAELLGYASHLWSKFGDEERAAQCKEVSRYYVSRWNAQRRERKAAQRHEEELEEEEQLEKAEIDEQERTLKRLYIQMQEMYEQLEKMKRQLDRMRKARR